MCQDEADDRPECPYGASCYRYVNLKCLVVLLFSLISVIYSGEIAGSFSSQAFNF